MFIQNGNTIICMKCSISCPLLLSPHFTSELEMVAAIQWKARNVCCVLDKGVTGGYNEGRGRELIVVMRPISKYYDIYYELKGQMIIINPSLLKGSSL
jgi:hypothetical protein